MNAFVLDLVFGISFGFGASCFGFLLGVQYNPNP